MPRNASGIYTLPGGNPVTPGDVIEADWANTTLEDVADALTNSLSRTGAGGMLAPFRIADGNISAPGLSYLNETNTGLYRSGSGSTWMSVLGVNVAQFSTVGLTIASAKALTALGNGSVAGTFAVGGATTLASTLAVTGALTATGGVLGNITAGSGTSTFNNVVINGNLDMDAGSSGTITNLPNPTNPGDAANKAYVDSQDALRLALTGGTMTGAIAMSNNKVTGVATPTADQDAANKAYVDSVAQGIDAKASCKAATTANITLSGNQTIDGVAIVAGERVLVKNQSSAADNGIYVAAVSTWSRAADANTWDELVAAFTFIESGTENGNNGYICTIAPGGTLGVTAVTWAQFSGAGQVIAGQGLSKTGNTIQVNTASSSRIVIGADDIDLATTGVVADTYKSVSVDAYGRVTGGTNPTTLAGFGIGDAYTQTQTNSLLAAKLSLAGGTMSGAIAMGGSKITGMADPTLAQDAATKNYIDTIFGSTATAAASAAAAATSASNAASSASAASTSATNAASSATSAAASATSAAASYDAFDDRYLGAKASDPTVDNDGNPLLTGALYWNTTSNQMRVYDGSAWTAAYLPAAGYALLASANTFTANQTITDNSSNAALKITQTGSGNALYIEDVAADATPFVVSSTGVVGIGTTTPDNIVSAGIALVSNAGYYPQLIQRNTAADANASYIAVEKDRNGAVVQNGDVLGNLVFRGFDGTQYLQGAYINAVVNATPGANDMPAALCFGVTPDGSAGPSEGMRLTSTGLVTQKDATIYGVTVGRGAGAVSTNTAVGASALAANTIGVRNTVVGAAAGATMSTADSVTAVGYGALNLNTGSSNTAIGEYVLQANSSGAGNTSLGFRSLYSNTTAGYNTAVGYQAAYTNTTGSQLVAVGVQALQYNTTGAVNTALGDYALRNSTTGNYNVASGSEALYKNTTGSNNTAHGAFSLHENTTASNNTAVGYQAAYTFNSSGTFTAIGNGALYSNSNTGSNTAVGYNAMRYNTTGVQNTALSHDALVYNTTGSGNTALGREALFSNTTSSYGTAVGYQAGYNSTGSNNTFLGYGAGRQVTTGTANTCIGDESGWGAVSLTTGSGNVLIGFGVSSASASSGNEVVIGGNGSIVGRGSGTGFIAPGGTATTGGGAVYQGNNSSSWSTTSDQRLKKNIADNNVGLSAINSIRVRNFEYRTEDEVTELSKHCVIKKEGVQLGVIAQELQAVLPECVKQESTGVLSVDTDNLTWYLINAVKELNVKLEAQAAEIATLKGN